MLAFDLGATILFAVEGALAALAFDLDVFGVLVVAFATALGGGIIRDIVIGAGPPVAFQYARYPVSALIGGLLVVLFAGPLDDISNWVLVTLDAGGLAAFAVSGARRAIDFELNWLSAILLGGLTGVGGSVIQGILLNEIPRVLREDVYASAALLGAAVAVFGMSRGRDPGRWMALGVVLAFALRMVSYWQGWNLPTVGG